MLKIRQLAGYLLVFFLLIGCTDDNSEQKTEIDKSKNLLSLGASAQDILSDQTYTSITIEIVYVNGYAPNPEAITQFTKFLKERIYKPDGIEITQRSVSSSGQAPFDIDEVAAIEKDERSIYTVGDEIAIYIYFADGSNEDDEDNKFVLGSAYRNTSMVIYGETINNFSERNNAPEKEDIQAAVLNHEFAHLLGLVDLGTEPQSDHKDDDNEGHCNVSGCLMQSSIEFGSGIVDVIDGGNIPQLDAACIDDLRANGGK